jgi:2-methylcitrate dehydratase PrpD
MSLARNLVARCRQPVPIETLDRARRHALDWVGCVIGAAKEPLAQTLAESVDKQSGAYPSFGIGQRSHQAALVYATALGNILEMDDLARAALLHPGPVVVPTAFYSGLTHQSRFIDALKAIVYGYETATRLGCSLDAHHYARWHPTTTVGIPAAAITAAHIIGLDEEQTLAALGNALSVSGGLWHMRHHNVSTKQWHIVHAVLTGTNSAAHAKLGFNASDQTIEGAQGWHEVLASTPSPAEITAPHPWAIETTSFKPWPACRHCHPAIDAALKIKGSIDTDSIRRIELISYADALTFCDNDNPLDAQRARFSLQHCVATALLHGDVNFADFESSRRSEPHLVELRNKVEVGVDDILDRAYPQHFGARIRIKLDSGITREATITDAKGDPERPLTDNEIIAKFKALWHWGLGDQAGADAVVDAILTADIHSPLAEILESAP